jgi:hypothetical protein
MKSLRILIFSMVTASCMIPSAGLPQSVYIRTGIYDFTDATAREFYNLAVAWTAGADVWNPGRLHLCVSSGMAFNSVKYNGHRHNLYMIPVTLDLNYDLLNEASKVRPAFGLGLMAVGKVDQNADFEKTFLALTYGYRATGSLRILLKKNLFLTLDLSYNLLLPPDSEEINISGVMTMVGLAVPIGKK